VEVQAIGKKLINGINRKEVVNMEILAILIAVVIYTVNK